MKGDDGAETDPDVRALKTMKANYSQIGTEIRMRWERGVFVALPTAGGSGLAAYAARDNADSVFMEMVAAYTAQHRELSPHPSLTYAPTLFSHDARSQGIRMPALRDAMNRLLTGGRLKVVESGPPSRRRKRLILAEQDG
ncbi:MAG: hypothetical protein ACHQAY_27310 [Hyphomicrobiales bacterium]